MCFSYKTQYIIQDVDHSVVKIHLTTSYKLRSYHKPIAALLTGTFLNLLKDTENLGNGKLITSKTSDSKY